MIINKTFFMLLVSTFTFFGLSALQNLSYFTDIFEGQKITINIAAQEEENETNTSKEIKENFHQKNSFENVLLASNSSHLLAYHHHIFTLHNGFLEVATPPPQS